MRPRKEKYQGNTLTMYSCDQCGNALTAYEHYNGTKCTPCIKVNNAAIKEAQKSEALNSLLAKWKEEEYTGIAIADGYIDHLSCQYEIWTIGKDLTPHVKIYRADVVLFDDSEDITSQEGREILQYMYAKKLAKQPTPKNEES